MALSWPLEQEGSKGENVRSIQYLLNEHSAASSADNGSASKPGLFGRGSEAATEAPAASAAAAASTALAVDGDFGPQTAGAVRAFQTKHGLAVDGKVGNQTWPALIIQVSTGSTGDAVSAVQSQIRSRSGWLTVDGIFGPETDSAVRGFQSFCELSVDGIVGPATWNALVLAYLRASGGQAAADLVYQAWTGNDRAAAAYEAISLAMEVLFARSWKASDGWTFAGSGV